MRMTHSDRTSPTELTFGSTDSWDTWRPYMAWKSTDSRWTFAKNNTTCKETTPKLTFYLSIFFQLASVLVLSLFYMHFPISVLQVESCEGYLQLKRLTSFPFTSHTRFFFFLNKDAVLLWVPRVPDSDSNIPELQELCTSGLSEIK